MSLRVELHMLFTAPRNRIEMRAWAGINDGWMELMGYAVLLGRVEICLQ